MRRDNEILMEEDKMMEEDHEVDVRRPRDVDARWEETTRCRWKKTTRWAWRWAEITTHRTDPRRRSSRRRRRSRPASACRTRLRVRWGCRRRSPSSSGDLCRTAGPSPPRSSCPLDPPRRRSRLPHVLPSSRCLLRRPSGARSACPPGSCRDCRPSMEVPSCPSRAHSRVVHVTRRCCPLADGPTTLPTWPSAASVSIRARCSRCCRPLSKVQLSHHCGQCLQQQRNNINTIIIINIYFVLKVYINITCNIKVKKKHNVEKINGTTSGLFSAQIAQQIICIICSESSDITMVFNYLITDALISFSGRWLWT